MCKCHNIIATTEYVRDKEYYWGVCLDCGRHWYELFTNKFKQQAEDKTVIGYTYQQWLRVGEGNSVDTYVYNRAKDEWREYHNE